LPLGIQVVGQPWREDNVLAALTYIESKRAAGRSRRSERAPPNHEAIHVMKTFLSTGLAL